MSELKLDIRLFGEHAPMARIKILAPELDLGRIYSKGIGETKNVSWLQDLYEDFPLKEIYVEGNLITLKKTDMASEWSKLAVEIGKRLKSLFTANELTTIEEKAVEANDESNAEANTLMEKVQNLIDEMIMPALASHGGQIVVQKIEGETLFVAFSGGCQGCSQVSATLKGGVETLIKEHIPEIKEIVDMTDHSHTHHAFYR